MVNTTLTDCGISIRILPMDRLLACAQLEELQLSKSQALKW